MRQTHGDTWIDDEDLAYSAPTGAPSIRSRRFGRVRFEDGKLRRVRLGVPDTYFSIPAVPMSGTRRKGHVTLTADSREFRFFSN